MFYGRLNTSLHIRKVVVECISNVFRVSKAYFIFNNSGWDCRWKIFQRNYPFYALSSIFKSLIWFWKKDKKYLCLLLLNSSANIFLWSLYLVWASLFKAGSFNLINFVRNFYWNWFLLSRCNPRLGFKFQFLFG